MASMKVVVKNHGVELLETFKKNLVGYSNTLWQLDIVTEAVKDKTLDSSVDVARSASDLLSNVSKTFSVVSSDLSKQTDHMRNLLKTLEMEGEFELVNKMRTELRESFNIEIPPFYCNPSSDNGRHPQYPQSEPIDIVYDDDNYLYTDSEAVLGMESVQPGKQRLVGLSVSRPSQFIRRRMVLPLGGQSTSRFKNSDPVNYNNRKTSHGTHSFRRSSSPFSSFGRTTVPMPSKSSSGHSATSPPMHVPPMSDLSAVDQALGYSSTSSPTATTHYEEQKQLCNFILVKRYEEEIQELKKKLNDKEKEIDTLKHNHQMYINQVIETLQSIDVTKKEWVQHISNIESMLTKQKEESENTKMKEEFETLRIKFQEVLDHQILNQEKLLNEVNSIQEREAVMYHKANSRSKTSGNLGMIAFVVSLVFLILAILVVNNKSLLHYF